MSLRTPVVWSDSSLLHEPKGEVWVGVTIEGTEVRARAEVIRAGERVSDVVGTELGDVRSATLSSIDGIRDVIVDAGRSIRAAGESLQE